MVGPLRVGVKPPEPLRKNGENWLKIRPPRARGGGRYTQTLVVRPLKKLFECLPQA